ncbi:hypothetical protein JCM10908_003612 [Rhodotorula pacifica]|uniref:nicotinamidase n=1 Tax=Rhodotorula pacifica TaxID=1495444 RepID=UPI0031718CDC
MTTALLIIDVQQGLCTGPDAVEYAEETITAINPLYAKAHEGQVPVIFVQHEDDTELVHDTPEWHLADGLHSSSADIYVRKRGSDAFHETSLEATLRSRGIKHLVICGMQTEFCVESTVRRALALGFEVTLVQDGHTTAPNGIISVRQAIAHHNRTLADLGAYGVRATVKAEKEIRFA